MKAIVIGNGESRKRIDLNSLKIENILIGCNAIHRDLNVDHLICCDRRMVEEAINNPETKNTNIYVRDDWFRYYRKIQKNKNVFQVPDLPYQGELKQDKPEHWGSGGYAVLLSGTMGFDEVRLVGFDLYSKNDKVNNIYKGTDNYAKVDSHSIDYSFWIYQLAKVFKHHPDTKFIIVNEKDWIFPKEWQYKNVSFENIDDIIC